MTELEEIQALIAWLKKFYLMDFKKKDKVIKKIRKTKEDNSDKFADWLESIRCFNVEQQDGLYKELLKEYEFYD